MYEKVDVVDCEHEKVYANSVICSYPAQYPWICKKCGIKKTDRDEVCKDNYDEICKRFE